jgi:periplasmic divalent cation tolerance protein
MLMIGWTTVETREQADSLARDIIAQGLAACVQIEGPITSHYCWNGKQEETLEFRLCLKFLAERESVLSKWILSHHPYETPEWITVRAENVSEKYLSWVRSNPTN